MMLYPITFNQGHDLSNHIQSGCFLRNVVIEANNTSWNVLIKPAFETHIDKEDLYLMYLYSSTMFIKRVLLSI